jgi:hypothetical protein
MVGGGQAPAGESRRQALRADRSGVEGPHATTGIPGSKSGLCYELICVPRFVTVRSRVSSPSGVGRCAS